MVFSLALDDCGLLTSVIADGGPEVSISTTDQAAPSDLWEAIESAGQSGMGECYCRQQDGEYRWLFRRDNDLLRIAVLRSSGTLTGWEHVFWSECDFNSFEVQVRDQIAQLPQLARRTGL